MEVQLVGYRKLGRLPSFFPSVEDILRAQRLSEFFDRHPDEAEPVKLGLIQLLVKEDGTFIANAKHAPQRGYPENDTEYYAEVIGIVSSLNDQRSIPALVVGSEMIRRPRVKARRRA